MAHKVTLFRKIGLKGALTFKGHRGRDTGSYYKRGRAKGPYRRTRAKKFY